MHLNDVDFIESDFGKYRLWPIFSLDEEKGFEIYIAEMDQGGILKS